MRESVVVGLSGGVDSAAALFFLKSQGYDCIGVHIRLADFAEEEGRRQAEEAKAVAERMGVLFCVLDKRREFCRHVTDPFIREYLKGRTPNPCVACNALVRWKALLELADIKGARWVATGHYARLKTRRGRLTLAVAADRKKDQSYFLYRLPEEYLKRTLFPLGGYEKAHIREILQKEGFAAAKKADSQEICFLGGRSREEWLGQVGAFSQVTAKERIEGCRPGQIVDGQGHVLGEHRGICFYTPGQRKGLGIPSAEPLYVQEICKDDNRIKVGSRREQFVSEAVIGQAVTVLMPEEIEELGEGSKGIAGEAKLRSSKEASGCRAFYLGNGAWKLVFDEPVWRAGKGQSAVFYQENGIILGGIIEG